MSSHDKDPFGEQDTSTSTSSESSKPNSDSEVDKAEENLDHLKLQGSLSKDSSVESKSPDSSNQDGITVSEEGPKTVPITRSRRLKESHAPHSDVQSDPGQQTSLQIEKDNEAKRVGESTVSTSGGSTPSYVSPPPSESSLDTPPIPPRRDELFQKNPPIPPKTYALARRFFHESSSKSEEGNTLADVTSIDSEVASYSGDAAEHDVAEYLRNPAPGLVRQWSEASDYNISDFLDDDQTPPLSTTSTSIATSSGEPPVPYTDPMTKKDMDNYLAGTSLGVAASKHSELENLKRLGLVGDAGFYRRSNMDVSDSSIGGSEEHMPPEVVHPESEPLEALLFRREQDLKESSQREHLMKGSEKGLRELEGTEKDTIGRQKDEERTGFSDSGAGSLSERKETLESKDSKASPKTQTGRKPWQRPGNLRSMQRAAVSSKDMDTSEESDPVSPSRTPSTELMETEDKDESLEKMSSTADESVDPETGLPESKCTLKQSDRVSILGTKRSSNEEEPMLESEVSEKKARKCKRVDENLTKSQSSEEIMGSSPKPEKQKPSKKAKSDAEFRKTRRTRSDSNGIHESVGLDYLKKSKPNPSDASSDEEETAL